MAINLCKQTPSDQKKTDVINQGYKKSFKILIILAVHAETCDVYQKVGLLTATSDRETCCEVNKPFLIA